MTTVKYLTLGVKDLDIKKVITPKRPEYEISIPGYDAPLKVTSRFFDSVRSVFKISPSLFELWDVEEVLNKAFSINPRKKIRVAIEEDDMGNFKLLGGAERVGLTYDVIIRKLMFTQCHIMNYHEGVVYAYAPYQYRHKDLEEAGFESVVYFEIPVDGHGNPRMVSGVRNIADGVCVAPSLAYFSLPSIRVRQFLFSTATVNQLNDFREVGQPIPANWANIDEARKRVFAQSQFVTLTHRLTVAKESAASLENIMALARFAEVAGVPDFRAYAESIGGNPLELYHLTSYNQLPANKRIRMPARCSLFEVITAVGKIASTADPEVMRIGNKLIGRFLSDEFDFEGISFADILEASNVIHVNFGGQNG